MSEHPIVVATDLSARSDRAIERGRQLAREFGVGLVLAHAVEGDTPKATHELLAKAGPALEREVLDVGEPARAMLLSGSAPERLAEAAARLEARAILVGPARHNEVRDVFLGTAVDALLRRASVPVIVVKRRARGPYARILLTTDFSEPSREALLAAAAMFPQADFVLLHTFLRPFPLRVDAEDGEAYGRQIADDGMAKFLAAPAMERAPATMALRIEEGHTAVAVEAVAQQMDADLVVLGTRGASGLTQALLGSQASDIIRASTRDLLVLNPTAG